MPSVTIVVLQEDIDRALRDRRLRSRRASFCPVARAACRALGLALGNVKVGSSSIRIWGCKDHDFLCVAASKKLASAIQRFDKGHGMRPGRFRIPLSPLP
jgi:hypothetical protein